MRLKMKQNELNVEMALIGAVLFDRSMWEEVSDLVSMQDFSSRPLSLIWGAAQRLDERGIPVDGFALEEYFQSTGLWDAEQKMDGIFAAAMDQAVTTHIEARDMADIVRRKAGRRALEDAGKQIISMAQQPGHDERLSRILEDAHGLIADIEVNRGGAGDWENASDAVAAELDALEKVVESGKVPGMSTGISKLDETLGGLHRGDLVCIAGASSMGKTSLATNIARGAALAETVHVGFISGEMTRSQLAHRMASAAAHRAGEGEVEYRALRNASVGQNEMAILRAGMALVPRNLSFNYKRGMSLADIRSAARRMKKEHPSLGILVVDYVQILGLDMQRGENKASAIGRLTMGLKVLAGDLDLCVILLSQVTRMKGREDKRPGLDDLRESGAIEQDSDVVMFVYREQYYLERSEPKWTDKVAHSAWYEEWGASKNKMDILIRKNRMGDVGDVNLYCNLATDVIVDDRAILETGKDSML
jgi:replicative DNA helicase